MTLVKFFLFFLNNIIFISLFSQESNFIDFEVLKNETIFFSSLPQVEIFEFKNNEERIAYLLLKRRVYKTYPFALIAKKKLHEIESVLNTIPKRRKKRRYKKEITKWVKNEYSDRLKKLTVSEGKILVKLIFRETGNTSYDIVKLYKGFFNALFWQTIAFLWDNNLKTKYDPINIREDMLIEQIIFEAKLKGKFYF